MWREAAAMTAVAGSACLALSEYEKRHFSVEDTTVVSSKLAGDRTFVFLSDLHNNEFGMDNRLLVEAIHRIGPDAVLCGGDMMVSKRGIGDVSVPLRLFEQLAPVYPVFYGNGNHENRMNWQREQYGGQYRRYRDALKGMGVVYLEDGTAACGEDILVSALDLDKRYYRKAFCRKLPPMGKEYLERKLGPAGQGRDSGKFRILLAHSPLYFADYAAWGADLALAGHFHGGTIRLPGLGGVMTPQYQFFLPCCAGAFEQGGKHMVVSRGLGTHSINIRLNNKPQLVVVRLKKQ